MADLTSSGPDGLTILFDADGTLVPQGADPSEFARLITAAVSRFEQLPGVGRVQVITNGPPRGAPVVDRVNKPWTRRRSLGLHRREPVWVVGDQVISDGLLAWRLGARFIQLAISVDSEPHAQQAMRRRGRWVAPLILRSDRAG